MSWKGMSGPRGPSGMGPQPSGENWLDWGKETKMRFTKFLPVGRDIKPVCTYKLVVSEDYDLGRTVNLLFFMGQLLEILFSGLPSARARVSGLVDSCPLLRRTA